MVGSFVVLVLGVTAQILKEGADSPIEYCTASLDQQLFCLLIAYRKLCTLNTNAEIRICASSISSVTTLISVLRLAKAQAAPIGPL